MLPPPPDTAHVLPGDTTVPNHVSRSESSSRPSLAEEIWNFRWSEFYPKQLASGHTIELASFEDFAQFAATHFGEIYGAGLSGPFKSTPSEAKERYYRRAGDFLSFRRDSKIVGMYVGDVIDWSGYYLRNGSILPTEQGAGLIQNFISYHVECLAKIGVTRVESEVSPSNPINHHVFNKLGFRVAGINLSERWGALTRFVLHLDPKEEQVFLNQFCAGVESQLKAKSRPKHGN